MQVTRLVNIEQCRLIGPAWDCMAHGNPFRQSAWLQGWWPYYQQGRELFVLQVTDDHDEVVGVAPWFIETSLRQGRIVRPLGCGEVCSEYLGILTTVEHEDRVIAELVQWLSDAAAGKLTPADRWDLLDLVSADAADRVMARLMEQLAAAESHVHKRPAMDCWRIDLPDTWDEYLGMLSKAHRKRVRRIDRKWLESGEARLHTVSDADDLQRGMQILTDLHQRRHEAIGAPGCFASQAFAGFLLDAAERLRISQSLRLHWLELQGRPVAAEFYLLGGETIYAYQAGIDPEALDLGPGQISQVATLKLAIAEKQRQFDFLRGDEPYKSHWRAYPRPCVDYRVVPHRPAAQLRHQMWLAGDTMKGWIRSGLQLAGMD